MFKSKPLNIVADAPRDTDADCVTYGFWRAWGRRRAVALANAVRRIRQLEHEVRLLRDKLDRKNRKLAHRQIQNNTPAAPIAGNGSRASRAGLQPTAAPVLIAGRPMGE